MERLNKTIITITMMFVMSSLSLISQDTIIDTVYSTPELDGEISYTYNIDQFWISSTSPSMFCGDYWNGLYDYYGWGRGFLSFYLPDIPPGYNLIDAYVNVYQSFAEGNGEYQFPVWDIYPQPDTIECILDHIDYGNSLDLNDWTAGDTDDPQTLHSNIGIISDNEVYEYKTMDISEYIINDYNNNRNKTQYRLRFWINTDWDNSWSDCVKFISANAISNPKPFIRFFFSSVGVDDNVEINGGEKISIIPNPFNRNAEISFSMRYPDNTISIYDIKGRIIHSETHLPIKYSYSWFCKEISSGIYVVKISNSKEQVTKKMTYLK